MGVAALGSTQGRRLLTRAEQRDLAQQIAEQERRRAVAAEELRTSERRAAEIIQKQLEAENERFRRELEEFRRTKGGLSKE